MSIVLSLILGVICGGSASLFYALAGEGGLLQLLLVYTLVSMAAGVAGAAALCLRYACSQARLSPGSRAFREASPAPTPALSFASRPRLGE